jgi:hypothetical protein
MEEMPHQRYPCAFLSPPLDQTVIGTIIDKRVEIAEVHGGMLEGGGGS